MWQMQNRTRGSSLADLAHAGAAAAVSWRRDGQASGSDTSSPACAGRNDQWMTSAHGIDMLLPAARPWVRLRSALDSAAILRHRMILRLSKQQLEA